MRRRFYDLLMTPVLPPQLLHSFIEQFAQLVWQWTILVSRAWVLTQITQGLAILFRTQLWVVDIFDP